VSPDRIPVVVIDDDPSLVRVMRIALVALGYETFTATTAAAGISEIALHSPGVVLLDLGLPDLDGIDVVRRIREWSDVPIVVLSADATEARKIQALDAGADDYVTKPFSMGEVQARLRVALRRAERATTPGGEPDSTASASPRVVVGPLELDLAEYSALWQGAPLELTRREFAFLAYLARHQGRVCTQRMILEAVWGPGYTRETQYLREYAYRLRRKLGDDRGTFLRTRAGIGYQLVAPEEESET
jgi:two-component system KDP operon response regulator KdpE